MLGSEQKNQKAIIPEYEICILAEHFIINEIQKFIKLWKIVTKMTLFHNTNTIDLENNIFV